MKIYRLLLVMSLLALLAGCSVGTKYSRPAVDAPASFRGAGPAPETGAVKASAAELDWWRIYGDETLQGLIKTALENNYDIRVAAARVEEFRALAGISRSAKYPVVFADASASRTRSSSSRNGSEPESSSYRAALDASYEIDLWGRVASLNEAARADLLTSEYAAEAVRTSLVSGVATTYFNLLALDEQLGIASRTVANRAKFQELTKSQFDNGTVSRLEVDRAGASLSSAKTAIPDIERQREQAENLLSTLLGRNPGLVTRGNAGLADMPVPPEVPAGLPSELLERRPDIRAAEQALVAANARANATETLQYPSLSLTGDMGIASNTLHNFLTDPSGVWSVAAAILQPIWNANRTGYLIEAAEARREQATLQYYNTVIQSFREVSDALAARARYAEQLKEQERQVEELRSALGRVNMRYEAGYSSYFEVVDADAALFGAELQLVQSRRNTLVSLVQLYKALGGGWSGTVADAEARK
ncbi:MAG: efflux transporter outer membrane subunit [Nitrospirae bacterium]|nr:efflux transporter outer membrane subunit [Nitrospirota bacterium]